MDRKRKLEEDENSDFEISPSKKSRRAHTIEFKMQVLKELESSNISAMSRKHKVTRSCIQDWKKNETKLSEMFHCGMEKDRP